MATLVSALLKAIRAQDDDFVKGILLRESLTDDEALVTVNEMTEDDCVTFFDVLVRLILQEPTDLRYRRWCAALNKRGFRGGAGNSQQALETLYEYEALLQPHLKEVHELASSCLQNAITRIQQNAIRKAKSELARGTRNSEPLLKYTVKH